MATYTIYVQNQSASAKPYAIFNAPPSPKPQPDSTGGQDIEPWSNVWGISDTITPPHGQAEFDIVIDTYAWCGTAPQGGLANGVTVSTSDYVSVTLATTTPGSDVFMAVSSDGGAGFPSAKATQQSVAGAFEITTDTYDPEQFRKLALPLSIYQKTELGI
jgi:hypothetical protein